MSHNRQFESDLRELDKGITDCENFLAKVLNKKIESSRQIPANKKKNVPTKSVTRPQSRGGVSQSTHQRTPSAGANSVKEMARTANPARKASAGPPQQRKPSPDPKPKSSDYQRKRSTSVSRLTSHNCRCEPSKLVSLNKLPVHVHVPRVVNSKVTESQVSTKLEAPATAVRSKSPESRTKSLSWGEVLKENQKSCKVDRGQWDIGGFGVRHPLNPLISHPSFTSKLPHECEPIKECSSSECTAVASCNHFFKVTAPRLPQEESFSSEGTSGFSSNNDLPSNLTNKSIQCGSPIPVQRPKSNTCNVYQQRRVSSSSSGASSQKMEEKDKIVGVLGSDVFSIFNPVRTLNFLIKELQGLMHKHPQEDDSICRVIADMEKVLHRLPESGERAESTSGYTTRSKPLDSHSVLSGSTQSCDLSEKPLDEEAQKAAILQALNTVPALARRIDERTESMRKKIIEAKACVTVPSFTPSAQESFTNSVDNILRLQRYVDNSGHQLEIMCQTMEQACEALRSERDGLQGEVEDKDKKLRVAKSQEQDFVTTVNSLRTNLESATRRVTQLSVENKALKEQVKEIPNLKYIEEKFKLLSIENAKLKEENKYLQEKVTRNKEEIQKLRESSQNQVGIAEATKRLTQRLQETMKERDEAQHDAQMLRIEREKLLVLQHNKDEELNHFVQDIINIKKMVTCQLNVLKTNVLKITPPASISDVLNSSSDSEVYSSTSQCQPVCSSPTSTASGVAPVDELWQEVSTILPEHTHSSPEVLISVSAKKVEETQSPTEFKSLARDTWQSVHTDAQGEGCVPEERPSRPRTAAPIPRPPVDHNVAGDNQWTGAAAVTQELQQNVQELFRFLNNKGSSVSSSTEVPSSSARTVASSLSTIPSSRQSSAPMQSARGSSRSIPFQMPRLPEPPKFLENPEFSDFSSYHGSLADSSSVESIDAVLKELQKNDKKRKGK